MRKVGNGYVITVPKAVADGLGWRQGDVLAGYFEQEPVVAQLEAAVRTRPDLNRFNYLSDRSLIVGLPNASGVLWFDLSDELNSEEKDQKFVTTWLQ